MTRQQKEDFRAHNGAVATAVARSPEISREIYELVNKMNGVSEDQRKAMIDRVVDLTRALNIEA